MAFPWREVLGKGALVLYKFPAVSVKMGCFERKNPCDIFVYHGRCAEISQEFFVMQFIGCLFIGYVMLSARGKAGNALEFSERALEFFEKPLEFSERALEFSERALEFFEKPLEFFEKPLEFSEKPLEFFEKPLEFSEKPLEFFEKPLEFSESILDFFESVLEFSETSEDFSCEARIFMLFLLFFFRKSVAFR